MTLLLIISVISFYLHKNISTLIFPVCCQIISLNPFFEGREGKLTQLSLSSQASRPWENLRLSPSLYSQRTPSYNECCKGTRTRKRKMPAYWCEKLWTIRIFCLYCGFWVKEPSAARNQQSAVRGEKPGKADWTHLETLSHNFKGPYHKRLHTSF